MASMNNINGLNGFKFSVINEPGFLQFKLKYRDLFLCSTSIRKMYESFKRTGNSATLINTINQVLVKDGIAMFIFSKRESASVTIGNEAGKAPIVISVYGQDHTWLATVIATTEAEAKKHISNVICTRLGYHLAIIDELPARAELSSVEAEFFKSMLELYGLNGENFMADKIDDMLVFDVVSPNGIIDYEYAERFLAECAYRTGMSGIQSEYGLCETCGFNVRLEGHVQRCKKLTSSGNTLEWFDILRGKPDYQRGTKYGDSMYKILITEQNFCAIDASKRVSADYQVGILSKYCHDNTILYPSGYGVHKQADIFEYMFYAFKDFRMYVIGNLGIVSEMLDLNIAPYLQYEVFINR